MSGCFPSLPPAQIIWILVTVLLLALIFLRKLALPNVIPRSIPFAVYIFAFLQLCVFVFDLAALAADMWSVTDFRGSGNAAFGVTGTHDKDGSGHYQKYADCRGTDDVKNLCGTAKAAGAFTLIFGLLGVFAALFATIAVIAAALGKSTPIDAWVSVLVNVEWVCALAQVMIWGVSFHNLYVQVLGSDSFIKLGASWALAFVSMILGIICAMYYAGGPGVAGQGQASRPPTTTEQAQPQVAVGPSATA